MYKSPIEIIYEQTQTQIENEIFRAVQRYAINVNKEELLKALKYDRQQYNKGYADGKAAAVKHGRWEQCFEDWRMQIEGDKCSVCGFEHY